MARLWPLISDSSLLSELGDQASYVAVDELQPDGSVMRRVEGQFGPPVAAVWLEDLGEWVEQRYVRQLRTFSKGAFRHVDFTARMTPIENGFDLHLRFEMVTHGPVGWIGAHTGMMRRSVLKVIATMEAMLVTELAAPVTSPDDPLQAMAFDPAPLARDIQIRLDAALALIADQIVGQRDNQSLADRLGVYLSQTPESWLGRIRPLVLARKWRTDPDRVVNLCLAAHHQGLLRLRWEVLCPCCRNASDVPDNLADLPHAVHCSTCNVDFEQDFSANVELTFQPEAWLRPLPTGAYCMMGAPSVPHIKVQRHVPAGSTLAVDPPLKPGGYRLRTIQAGHQSDIEWDGTVGFPTILATGDQIIARPADTTGEPGSIVLDNQTDRNLTFVIEQLAWRQDALTGDRAIAMLAFQQYCPEQILRPGDDVAIANVVLLFSDLKGSTSMYEPLGDGAAYNLVRDHFDYLTALVAQNGGVLVKTIGDAVMAAFSDAGSGVQAALAMQTGVAGFNQGRVDGGIVLKIGLHQGPCIAVTTDQRLDYFGSTVNVAARLQGESVGGDVVLSHDLKSASGVSDHLAKLPDGALGEEEVNLRGVEKPVRLWRINLPNGL
ncbi:MAG: DUF5939 domain-containing protein [Alphaproteobacteria bacterium]|nr:DUF5939 domain-containing protein [Alphaproteobacteria bacterium]